jgi:hypothetical protein
MERAPADSKFVASLNPLQPLPIVVAGSRTTVYSMSALGLPRWDSANPQRTDRGDYASTRDSRQAGARDCSNSQYGATIVAFGSSVACSAELLSDWQPPDAWWRDYGCCCARLAVLSRRGFSVSACPEVEQASQPKPFIQKVEDRAARLAATSRCGRPTFAY